jgi:hypothetical protein
MPLLSTTEANVVKVSLALGDTGTADGTGVCKMAGTLDGSAAIGGGEGVAVIVGGGVQLGELVGTAVAVAVAVGNMRLGTSTTTGVGVVAGHAAGQVCWR